MAKNLGVRVGALTPLQGGICQLLAQDRKRSGESYIAGALSLNTLIGAPRISRGIDVFHDTEEALRATVSHDIALLEEAKYSVDVQRRTQAFADSIVSRGTEQVEMQWARDSAFRFFPLLEHSDFGLVLHPFDAATNKVLALVGRLEVRDWIDVIECDARLQPLGFLAWAASGKDPGFSPAMILAEGARSGRYSALEVSALEFEGKPPDAAFLSQQWRAMRQNASEIIQVLPPERVGRCVLDERQRLFRGDAATLQSALSSESVYFHEGTTGGAWPHFK